MGELVEFLTQNEDGFRRNRLPALYSDFRGLRATNPDGYAANVAAWRRALASITRSGLVPSSRPTAASSSSAPIADIFILNTDESLLRALESKQYGRPLALGAVIQEAVAEGDLVPLQDFQSAKQSIYSRGGSSWASLPWAVVSWGLRQAGLTSAPSDKLPKARFVVLANLEAAAKAFSDLTADSSSRFDRTWSKTHFVKSVADKLFPTQVLSATDLDVLLTFMSRDKGLVVYDGSVVKVKDSSAATTPNQPDAVAISAEDKAIAQLRELTESLHHQTRLLNKRIDELEAAAKEAVAKKNRVSALAALKSKKQAETSLQARYATLSQLEEVASKIEQAADQVQLVKVMASSGDALRSLNQQVGDAEEVADVVDRLREQMGAVDEVGSILAEAASGAAVIDEGEIDDELAMMEREGREKEEAIERAKREAAEVKEAEETRRRLEAIEGFKEVEKEKEVAEGIRRISLQEQPQTQPAS